jgi:N-acyl-phosphatidylethanolamine-hydrolysing phospholipase D
MLTDPIFSERASPVQWAGPQRAQPPGVAAADLPRIDVVMISHNHYDHLRRSQPAHAQPPAGRAAAVPGAVGSEGLAGRASTSPTWWNWTGGSRYQRSAAAEFVLTPCKHWSGRSLTDRMHTLWGGYAVLAPDLHLFFAGDTGYSTRLQRHRRPLLRASDGRRGFDIALIPVGAYEPRWFMAQQHVDPSEAVRIHLDLRAKRSMGIHWGTFELTDESTGPAAAGPGGGAPQLWRGGRRLLRAGHRPDAQAAQARAAHNDRLGAEPALRFASNRPT